MKPLLDVFLGKPAEFPPVWIMRQAGRYLPKYRAIRERYDFLTMCKTPELAAEVSLQPVELFDMDAAIIFSDIMVVSEAMGLSLEFIEGKGPVFQHPIRTLQDVKNLRADVGVKLDFVFEALKIVARELSANKTLIGFAGAPFTLACYMVEGMASRNYIRIKSLMYREEKIFSELMCKLSQALVDYFCGQVNAGAEVLMLFDTYGGIVSPADYRRYLFPCVKTIVEEVKKRCPNIPIIYFVKHGAGIYPICKNLAIDGIGVDWTVSLDTAVAETNNRFVVQGNLDPTVLFAKKNIIAREVQRVIAEGKNARGHIFNLGHGILPETPVDNVKFLLEVIRCQR